MPLNKSVGDSDAPPRPASCDGEGAVPLDPALRPCGGGSYERSDSIFKK